MDTISNYKNRAIENLTGNWDTAAIVTLVYFLIIIIPTKILEKTSENMGNIWLLIALPIGWGFTVMFLSFIRGEELQIGKMFLCFIRGEELQTGKMFDGIKSYGRIFRAYLAMCIAIFIGSILLVVPGIIAWLMFSQVPYVLKDDPKIGIFDALQKSAKMMDGHKTDLFLLIFSFIGWFLLSILTAGIGFLFLSPYYETTCAHFYEDLKAEKKVA
ncbi:MAG: DUF975 family protein [Prevotella sp.]|nr:DUF975 family protein [Prevotella sp.]